MQFRSYALSTSMFLFFAVLFLFPALPVSAEDVAKLENPLKFDTIQDFLLAIIDILIILLLPIIILAIIYAGFLFVTAQGNEDKINTAKTTLLWAVIGGVLILGARVLVDVLVNTVEKLK